MADKNKIEKIYKVSILDGQDSVDIVEQLNEAFDKLRATKKKLNAELDKAILDKKSQDQIEGLRKKMSDLEQQMNKVSQQRKKAEKDVEAEARATKILADIKVKEAQAEKNLELAKKAKSQRQIAEEKELDRLIAKEEKQNRKIQESIGYYNRLKNELSELFRITKGSEKTDIINFRGNSFTYDQAIQKLRELSAEEQNFRRQFAQDQLLVGEYTTGIIQAFKQLGLDDLIAGQVNKAKDKINELDRTFELLESEYRQLKKEGAESFEAVEREMVENRKQAQALQADLKGINERMKSVDDIGFKVTNGLKNGFKEAGKQLATYALGLFSIQALFEGGRKTFDTTLGLDSLDQSLKLVSGSAEELATNERFLIDLTERLGLEALSTSVSFKNFFAAYTQAGGTADQAREIYEAAAESAAALKLSQDDANGVFRAFGQIASKGTVQSEELRGQIGERIPGAFSIAARAIGVTQQELNKMLEQGQVISSTFLPKFAAELKNTFGNGGKQVEGLAASVGRLKNQFTSFVRDNQSGLTLFFSLIISISGAFIGLLGYMPAILTFLGLYSAGWVVANRQMVLARANIFLANAGLVLQRAYLGLATIATTSYNAALAIFTGATRTATAATVLFGNAIRFLPLGLVLTAIGLLVAGYRALANAATGTLPALRAQAEINLAANRIYQEQTVELNKLFSVATNMNISLNTRRSAIQKLIDQHPEYFGGLKAETATVAQLKDAYSKLSAEILENARVKASADLAAKYQGRANKIATIQQFIEEGVATGNKKFDVIKDLEPEDRRELLSLIQNTDANIKGDIEIGGIKYDSKTILKRLDEALKVRQKVADSYNAYAATYQDEVDAKNRLAAEKKKAEQAERIAKGDITGTEAEALIASLEKDLAALKLNDPKRRELEAQIKKYRDLLNPPKDKKFSGSKLTGVQKDQFKDIDAYRDTNLAIQKSNRINNLQDETSYLNNVLKINNDAIDKKLALLKGANAEERKIIAELKLEKLENEKKTNEDLFKIQSESLKNRFETAVNQEEQFFEQREKNPLLNEADKAEAKVQLFEKLLSMQQAYHTAQLAIEKNYGIDSTQEADARAKVISGIEGKLSQARIDSARAAKEQLLKNIEDAASIAVNEEKKIIAARAKKILEDDSLSPRKKAIALRKLELEETKKILIAEISGEKLALDQKKKLLEDGLITKKQFSDAETELKLKQLALTKLVANEEMTMLERLKNAFSNAARGVLGLRDFEDENEKASAAMKEAAEITKNAINTAYQAYFTGQANQIEQRKQDQIDFLEKEKQRVLARASSEEERATIEAKYEAKRKALEKKAAEEKRQLALKQAAIDFAAGVIKSFAQYGWPLGLIPVAALTLQYFAQRSAIKAQQFAEGGQVQPQPLGSGPITVGPNIPTQPNGDNVFATVRTGEVILNEKQQMALGGARTFAAIGVPGFDTGGLVGGVFRSGGVQPPVIGNSPDGRLLFGSDVQRNINQSSSDIEELKQLVKDTTKTLAGLIAQSDAKPVVATEVEAKNRSRKNSSSVGVI